MGFNSRIISGVLFACILCIATPVLSAPTVIRFSHAVSDDMPRGQVALKFKDLVEQRLSGKYVVDIYPNAEMFGDDKIFQALLLDDVQMGIPDFSWFGRHTKKLQLFDLPFLFKDMAAVESFEKSSTGQELLGTFQDSGLVGLGYLNSGFKQMSATKKLLTPKDAKGLKFRIMSSDVLEAQFNAVGAEAHKEPFSQVFSLLSIDSVDGQENAWMYIHSEKFYTVQPYITESNHGLLGAMAVTSVNFWESVSAQDQKVLKGAISEALAYGNSLSQKKADEAKQKIVDSGKSEILQLTASQRASWVKAMKPVWKQFENEIGADLIEQAYSANK